MNAQIKATIIALALVVTNWHWSSSTQRPNMSSSVHVDGATIGILICGIALTVLLVRLWRLLRSILDKPMRIPKSERLISWTPVLMLLPLFFSFRSSATTTSGDATTTINRGYGCEASALLFFVASAMLLAFQAFSELRRISEHDKIK